jgi:N2-acetyl-L-2,4-diaminobutanoate deacetylase
MTAVHSPITTDIDFEQAGKQVGYLRVPHSRDSSAWGSLMIPLTVLKNGAGPTLLLIGGSHGGEYEGPVCLMKLARELEADDVQGRIIIIPALNLPAVSAGRRLSPIDQKDMNRVFPGRPNGTVTEVIAHYIHDHLLPLCDAVLDLHSGGYSLDLLPYISMHYLENEQQRTDTLAALKAFQAPYALIMEEFSGAGLLDYAVEDMGKIFLCAEIGGSGRLTAETLRIAERGTRNLLKHFGLIAGDIVTQADLRQPDTQFLSVPDAANYHAVTLAGIYEPFYATGDRVTADSPLGQIHFVEQPTWEPLPIIAQRSGLLIGQRGPGHVEIGDCVAVLAQPWVGQPLVGQPWVAENAARQELTLLRETAVVGDVLSSLNDK